MGKTMVAVSRGTELGMDWVVLTLRDGQAVNAARYLFEGARVAVEGRLHCAYRSQRQADGSRCAGIAVSVVGELITYLSPRPSGSQVRS